LAIDDELDRLVQEIGGSLGISEGPSKRFQGRRSSVDYNSIPENIDLEPPAPDISQAVAETEAQPPSDQSADDQTQYPLNEDIDYYVWYGTNREPAFDKHGNVSGFSNKRSSETFYGRCRVFVPKSHKFGSIGSGFWKRLWAWDDDRLKLLATLPESSEDFWQELRVLTNQNVPHSNNAVVFIHGYNVSFEDAALRTAQLAVDLELTGPMAMFSWPSRAEVDDYTVDEATIGASEGAIEKFLRDFIQKSGAEAVHVVAHSMGNRGLLAAIERIATNACDSTAKFGQVILAAADVDADHFSARCIHYPQLATQTTMYVSSKDRAVQLSRWLHGYDRAGLTPPIRVFLGIDTVSASKIDLTILGHGYVAEARSVLRDIQIAIKEGLRVQDRPNLEGKKLATGEAYWEFIE